MLIFQFILKLILHTHTHTHTCLRVNKTYGCTMQGKNKREKVILIHFEFYLQNKQSEKYKGIISVMFPTRNRCHTQVRIIQQTTWIWGYLQRWECRGTTKQIQQCGLSSNCGAEAPDPREKGGSGYWTIEERAKRTHTCFILYLPQ